MKLHQELQSTFPTSQVARFLPLTFTSGALFESLVDDYLRKGIRKGSPALVLVCLV